jgi:hypothetical protein
MSVVAEDGRARFDYPTLRKEREGWGTRRLVAGTEPEGRLLAIGKLGSGTKS